MNNASANLHISPCFMYTFPFSFNFHFNVVVVHVIYIHIFYVTTIVLYKIFRLNSNFIYRQLFQDHIASLYLTINLSRISKHRVFRI